MHDALEWAWQWHHELFAISAEDVRDEVSAVVAQVRQAGTLSGRESRCPDRSWSGRAGEHSDDLIALLADMQSVARAHPEATW